MEGEGRANAGIERGGQDARHVPCSGLADHRERLQEARAERLDDDGIDCVRFEKGAQVVQRGTGLVGGDGDGAGGAHAGKALDGVRAGRDRLLAEGDAVDGVLHESGQRLLLGPGAVRIDADFGIGAEGGAYRAQPVTVECGVAADLNLHSAEAARRCFRSLTGEVVGIDCHQEGVRGDRGGSGGRETRLLREPVREGRAAGAREEVGESGLDGDIRGGDSHRGEREGVPGIAGGATHECGRDCCHAGGQGDHAETLSGKGSAFAEACGAIRGLDADDQSLALGECASAGRKGFTQGNAPGPPANARDGGGGGHGRRGNLSMSE